MSPSSVDVRSMDMTPGAAVDSRSDLPTTPPPCAVAFGIPLEPVERLDALLVRPLVLGSRSVRGIVLPWGARGGIESEGASVYGRKDEVCREMKGQNPTVPTKTKCRQRILSFQNADSNTGGLNPLWPRKRMLEDS